MISQLKYYTWIIGCQMNQSDGERVASVLENLGFLKAERENEADLIVVLACSVRQTAIDRIYGKVKKWNELKRKNSLITILSGCVLPQDKSKMEKIFDVVFEMKDLRQLPQILHKLTNNSKQLTGEIEDYFSVKPKYQSKFQAYVPIMTGCDNFCTYCAVPYTKGREKSRLEEEILFEVQSLVSGGCKEITLLGQNVNSYSISKQLTANSKQGKNKFVELLKKINNIPGNFWIRFMTSNPQDMSDELIRVIKECDKVCEYIHLPVQAGNDEILKKMNRKYTRKHYLKLIEKIRREIPDVAISTDTIVGFPGETKKQFEDTVDIYKKVKYDMAYIAQYSPRKGTVAATMKDDISREKKKRRDRELTEILKKTALENNKRYIGDTVKVLVEREKQGSLFGRTRTFKLVQFAPLEIDRFRRLSSSYQKRGSGFLTGLEGSEKLVGVFVNVKVISVTPWAMRGKIVE